MNIGIASPISSACLTEYLNDSSASEAMSLSCDYAPAVTTLAKEFLKAGHKLVVFTLDPKATAAMTLTGERLTIYVAPVASSQRLLRALDPLTGRNVRLIGDMFRFNKEHIDVMSVHWTRDYAVAARYYIGKIPVYVTVRDILPYIIRSQKIGLRSYKWLIIYLMNEWVMRKNSYNLIANSEYTAYMVRNYWKKEIPVIPNPIQDKYFKLENTASNPNDKFIISTISISQPDDKRKNISTLLSALKIAKRQNSGISLNLIGQAFTNSNPVITQWREAGLMEGVCLKGALSHDKVLEALCKSHLMVHPSLEETFGNTLIEAMAAGCPVLGGDKSGAVPYVLGHGQAGYLCDVTDAQALADAILSIAENWSEARDKAIYAKDYCRSHFSSERIMQEYLNLFSSES